MSDRAVHPGILQREASALVVIDMQEPFINSVFDGKRLVDRTLRLVTGCSLLKVPIIGTTQYAMRMGDIVPEIRHKLPVAPAHDKMAFDCCGSSSFLDELRSTGASQVILCGVECHICVCQTALGLVHRGYHVHLAADCVSSRSDMDIKLGIDKMLFSGVVISSLEMALYEMMGDAAHPAFRDVLALVK